MVSSVQPWRCSSCSLASVVGSLVLLILLLHVFTSHLFLSPLEFSGAQTLTVRHSDRLDFSSQDGAVSYRGAPWKAEIGRWLSGCHSISTPVNVTESISGKDCEEDCNGRGVCNRELGKCRCYHGFSGEGCSDSLHLDCNFPGSPEQPYGPWFVSICPAYCDTTRARCFCGQGTKYPNRPVAMECGFKIKFFSDNGQVIADWTKFDIDDIFSTNGSKPGWCNVNPNEAYQSKVRFGEECECRYDGLAGEFCEIPTVCSCVNQCSGNGHCHGGFCQCDRGWYGIDCSIPSASSIQDWPRWLRPSTVDVAEKSYITNGDTSIKAVVRKKRPLIYVYDLPPDFNSQLLEGRQYKYDCVNRVYTDRNRTLWTEQLYGSQIALYESILSSSHRTLKAEEADYFYVPVLDSCLMTRADDTPHLSTQEHMGLRSFLTLDVYKNAYDHIIEQYPYWNRSSGRDHIWFFSWDEGACYAPKEIWNSMMLVHWGNTNSKHNHSTTAFWPDSWDDIPSERRGDHPCFDPEKDLVLPAWKSPDPVSLSSKFSARPRKERTTLFYFNGNLGPAYEKNGQPEMYSMGIREKVAKEFGSTPDLEGKLGRQFTSNVVVTPVRSPNYHNEIASSIFCGVFPGDGWSGRMEDSLLQGCIPVVIQDGIFLPYENFLDYKSFAVRVPEREIPNLIHILRGFNETEVEFLLANVRKIWQRFTYRDSILLEAQRQKRFFITEESWATEFSKLGEDDVFATFIQVLHYKLHNDAWRQNLSRTENDFGLPKVCQRRAS